MNLKKINFSLIMFLFSIFSFGQFDSGEIILQKEFPAHGFIEDINGDGNKDLIVAIHVSNKIVWFDNESGLGDFDTTYQLINSEVDSVTTITGADIDGDGDIDIISASANDKKIAWYENLDGQGNFGIQNIIAEDIGDATFVTTADMDNDGSIDIIFSSSGTNGQISWYRNIDGQGSFMEAQVIFSGNCYAVAPFDIDGDGDLDVAIGDTKLRWSENINGQGQFATPIILESGKCTYIEPVDMDLDGREDLAVFQDLASKDPLSWFKNIDGLGDFSKEVVHNGSGVYKARTIKAGDFDQDGDIDLITTTWGKVGWNKNSSGDGPSGVGTPLNQFSGSAWLNPGFSCATIGDVDNDGDLDVVGLTGEETYIHVFHMDATSDSFQESKFHGTADAGGYYFSLADLDGDSDMDIICTATKGSGDDDELAWLENKDGQGDFDTLKPICCDDFFMRTITTAFIDDDANVDIIFEVDNKLSWIKNIGGPDNLSNPILIDSTANIYSRFIFPVDIDNDGDNDLLTGSSNAIGWYENVDALGTFSTFNVIEPDINNFINNFVFEDIDGDGDRDIVVAVYGNSRISWYENLDGLGNFSAHQVITFDVNNPSYMILDDMDADGDNDIIFMSNPSEGIFMLTNEDGAGNFSDPMLLVELESAARGLKVVDIDNDLDLDLVITFNGTNQTQIVWYENRIDNFWLEHEIEGSGDLPNFTAVGDINSDGNIDIISVPIYDGKILWYRNLLDDIQVSVTCFYDENENGIFDNNEQRLYNQQVMLNEQTLNNWTNETGQIFYHLDVGDYTFEYTAQNSWTATTSTQINISITDVEETQEVFFGVKPINPTKETTAELYSIGATRCGFTVPFVVGFANTGAFINDGYLALELDTLVSFNYATPSPDSIFENTLFWKYENLYPFEVRGIYLTMVMPGVDFIGQDINMSLESYFYENMDTVLSHTSSFESTINCSYDPNDKNVKPDLDGDENYALFGEYLEYTIRFQNTGTDTAFNIRIDDYLDSDLDWTTFQPIMASHLNQVSLDESTGKLSYFFKDILLPDSTTNEIASHGFFNYKIKPKSNLPENTIIENTAEIFFDYNPAVITNTIQNTLVPIFAFFEKNNNDCFEDQNGSIISKEILAVAPYQFLWSNGSTDLSLHDLEGGDYNLTITDGNNIEHYYDFLIETPIEISSNIISTPDVDGNSNGTISVMPVGGIPPYNYLWSTSPAQDSTSINELDAGLYFVTITDSNSCIRVDSIEVESITGLVEAEVLNRFLVYPNPSNSDVQINIDLNRVSDFTLKISSVTGQKIREFEFTKQINVQQKIEVEVLPQGVYFIGLEIDGRSFVKKLVIL